MVCCVNYFADDHSYPVSGLLWKQVPRGRLNGSQSASNVALLCYRRVAGEAMTRPAKGLKFKDAAPNVPGRDVQPFQPLLQPTNNI